MKRRFQQAVAIALTVAGMAAHTVSYAASAVAADPATGKYGYSYGKATKAEAEAEAKAKCGGAATIIASTDADGHGAVLRSHDIFRMPGEKVTVDAVVGQKDPVGARKFDTEKCKECQFVVIWYDNAKTAKGGDLSSGSGSGDIPVEITWRFFTEHVSGWEEYETCVKCPKFGEYSPFRASCPHGFYYEYNKETDNHKQWFVKGAGFDCKKVERWQEFDHITFKVDNETYWKDDKQNGFYRRFFSGTTKVSEYTEWKDGKENGVHMTFNQSGNVTTYGQYKDGKKTGVWKEYNSTTGLLDMENTYVNGEKSGAWIDYYPNGKKSQEKNYKGSDKNGPMIKWNEQGVKTLETNYINDKEDGVHKEYDNTGALVMEQGWHAGKKEGVFKKYNGATKKPILEASYKDGEEDGEWKEYDRSTGAPTLFQNYTNGKRNGEYKEWDKGVLVIDGAYVDGRKDGEWKVIRRGEKLTENYIKGIKVN